MEGVDSWSVFDKRIMTAHVVAEAWEEFCRNREERLSALCSGGPGMLPVAAVTMLT